MLHENGKKHRENVERAMQERRMNKQREEKAQKFLADSLRQMEQAALAGTGGNSLVGRQTSSSAASAHLNQHHNQQHNQQHHRQTLHQGQHNYPQGSRYSMQRGGGMPLPAVSSSSPNIPQQFDKQARQNQKLQNQSTSSQLQQERIDWQAQKSKREETNMMKRKKREGDDGENDDEHDELSSKRAKVVILPGEGFYSYEDNEANDVKQEIGGATKQNAKIYLEGDFFFGLLEEDMPIQIWTGPSSCSRVEKQQSTNLRNWRNALVLQVVNRRSTAEEDQVQRPSVHVSYMLSHDDTEETIEKNVSMDRIRIILGSDEKIPDSLEEARLLAMGGEEIRITGDQNAVGLTKQEIEEATGLSGWSTVSIKKTSHRQQHREERNRLREQKVLAAKRQEEEQKRIAERRLEESRVSNADDSALGAYDVWGKMDYKGVDISKEVHTSVEDSAKRLAVEKTGTGGKIAFKKRAKKKGQKAARRRTSADDD